MSQVDPNNRTRKRYNRVAFLYDFIEAPMEWLRFASWRARLQGKIVGGQVLEVKVGTGRNFSYYPQAGKVTAIDISPRKILSLSLLVPVISLCNIFSLLLAFAGQTYQLT